MMNQRIFGLVPGVGVKPSVFQLLIAIRIRG